MSLALAMLTAANAATYEQALKIYTEKAAGVPDESGELAAYAKEVYDAYGDDDWPFGGDPIVGHGFVLLTVNHESYLSEVPELVARAHQRGLVALDPQEEKLFSPGDPYLAALGDRTGRRAEAPGRLKLEMTAYYADGTSEEMGVVYDQSRWWRWGPGRLGTWLRLTGKTARRTWRAHR